MPVVSTCRERWVVHTPREKRMLKGPLVEQEVACEVIPLLHPRPPSCFGRPIVDLPAQLAHSPVTIAFRQVKSLIKINLAHSRFQKFRHGDLVIHIKALLFSSLAEDNILQHKRPNRAQRYRLELKLLALYFHQRNMSTRDTVHSLRVARCQQMDHSLFNRLAVGK